MYLYFIESFYLNRFLFVLFSNTYFRFILFPEVKKLLKGIAGFFNNNELLLEMCNSRVC